MDLKNLPTTKGRKSISCVFIQKNFSYTYKTISNFSNMERSVKREALIYKASRYFPIIRTWQVPCLS